MLKTTECIWTCVWESLVWCPALPAPLPHFSACPRIWNKYVSVSRDLLGFFIDASCRSPKFIWAPCAHTAKTKYQNFETNIPRKGISGSQSQFPHSCVCEWFLYSHDRSAYSAGGNTYVERSWDYLNRSLTHECGNWGSGRAFPRKGIHMRNFLCSAAVLIGWSPATPPPLTPHLGAYTRALLVSQDRRHLFVTPCFKCIN